MSLKKATIEELRQIIAEDYGRELTFGEVEVIANGLVGYFDILAKIYHRGQNKSKNQKN